MKAAHHATSTSAVRRASATFASLVMRFGLLRSEEAAAAPDRVGTENERGGHGRAIDDAAGGKQRQIGEAAADARKQRHGRRLGPIVPAGLGPLDDERIGAKRDRLL